MINELTTENMENLDLSHQQDTVLCVSVEPYGTAILCSLRDLRASVVSWLLEKER